MSGDEPVIRLGITIPDALRKLVAAGSGGRLPGLGADAADAPDERDELDGPDEADGPDGPDGPDAPDAPDAPDVDRPDRAESSRTRPRGMGPVSVIELAGTIDEFPDPAVLTAIAARLPESMVLDVQAPRIVATHRSGSASVTDHASAAAASVDRYALWERFRTSLAPLASARRLGCVIVRLPSEVDPSAESWAYLATLPERLPGFPITVEVGPGWLSLDRRSETFRALAGMGLGFAGPPFTRDSAEAVSGTAPRAGCAVVRVDPGDASRTGELSAWVRGLHPIVSTAREVHVLLSRQDPRSAGAGHGATGWRAPESSPFA